MSFQPGVLYVVATPLGNLGDMTYRAVEMLKQVDVILAEDTRHSRKLLDHYGIQTQLQALHEHNELQQTAAILATLQQGKQVAIISDAGTPLISDPGFVLVREAQSAGIRVVPIPGASAVIAALSVAGLPTDRFVFEGFLPAKSAARQTYLQSLRHETRTMVFYEAPHRILDTLEDLCQIFEPERTAVMARELTKTYETVCAKPLQELRNFVAADTKQQLGEVVLLLHGAATVTQTARAEIEIDTLLTQLLEHLSVKNTAQLVAALTGQSKNALYDRALQLSQPKS